MNKTDGNYRGVSEQQLLQLDSALLQAADCYSQGNPLRQKAILDSIQPFMGQYEDGSNQERDLYARFLRCNLTYFAQYTNKYDSMLYYGTKAKQHAMAHQDYPTAVLAMANLGDIMRQRGDMLNAFSEYFHGLRLNDSIVKNPHMYLAIFAGISCSFTAIRNIDQAEMWAKRMENYGSSMSVVDSISYYSMLGNCYYYAQRYDDCLQQFTLLDKFLQKHPELVADRQVCNVNLADIYVQTYQHEKVGRLLDDALQYFTDNGITSFLPYLHTLQIQDLQNQGKHTEACQLAVHYKDELGSMSPDHRTTRYLVMSVCAANTGKYQEALEYHRQFTHLSDSIHGHQVHLMSQEMEQRYRRDGLLETQRLELQEHQVLVARLWAAVFLLACIITGSIAFYRKKHFENRRQRELALNKILQLRNQVVHNRITPHFISNALVLGADLTKEEISEIVSLIRTNLSYEHEATVCFDKELEMARRYIRIAKRIQPHRIQHESFIDPQVDISHLIVPSMSLLIVVENAVKHGTPGPDGILHIQLRLNKTEKGLLLEVENDGNLTEYYQQRDSAMHGLRMLRQMVEITNTLVTHQEIHYELCDTHKGKVIAKFNIYGTKYVNR